MDALALARWQFAITTLYHYIFVPLTIGLTPIVAGFETAWYVTRNERWLRLTKFFGKLLLINFAIGIVTGIVQEFQFGMNWSEYSRYVGDIFGAPLAMEAMGAFFVESTFLGLWIFGWDRLSKKVHLACIWLMAFAVNLSAFFIMAANSWMQNPVGAVFNPASGRAELTNISALFTNPVFVWAFPHTITAAFVTAGTFVTGIATWWMIRLARTRREEGLWLSRDTYRPAVVVGATVLLIAGLGVIFTGDGLGQVLYELQPAKMSAAEALCDGQEGAPFTPVALGAPGASCDDLFRPVELPGVASFLARRQFTGPDSRLPGLNDIQAEFSAAHGMDNVLPPLQTTFWSFRFMIGLGIFSAALALWALWATWKGKVSDNKLLSRFALGAIAAPFLAGLFGWIFTEVGRQPWVVYPTPMAADSLNMPTALGVSRVVPGGTVLLSMVIFTLLYGILGVIWFRLMHRYVIEGVGNVHDESPEAHIGNTDIGVTDEVDQPSPSRTKAGPERNPR